MKLTEYIRTPGEHREREIKIMRNSFYGVVGGVLLTFSTLPSIRYYNENNLKIPKMIEYFSEASFGLIPLSGLYLIGATGMNVLKANKKRKSIEKEL